MLQVRKNTEPAYNGPSFESKKSYNMGLYVFVPVAINPTMEELHKLGLEYIKQEPSYEKNDNGSAKVVVYFKGAEGPVKDKIYPMTIFLKDEVRVTQSGKKVFEFMDNKLVHVEIWEADNLNEATQKLKEEVEVNWPANPKLDWKTMNLESSYQVFEGERKLIHLLAALANFKRKMSAEETLNKADLPYKIQELMKGKITQLKAFFKTAIQYQTNIIAPLALKLNTRNGKEFVEEVLLPGFSYQESEVTDYYIEFADKDWASQYSALNLGKKKDDYRFTAKAVTFDFKSALGLFKGEFDEMATANEPEGESIESNDFNASEPGESCDDTDLDLD